MNGLRVYMNLDTPDRSSGDKVFYSRRADGPYYQWIYQELLGRWLASRLHAFQLSPSQLTIAPWKCVPTELKSRLAEHYLE